ncbi:MAG: zinc-ribbon domain-containing protein [Chloroflexi bacterium]|nr:MAG: zinc-ribbon domain-containing protein [Chloroflexota bacterium]
MALVCPRCATQNPDGNTFCQACGSPLNAPPPAPAMPVVAVPASPFTEPPAYTTPPPPAAYAPPPPPPAAYQSPFYPPGSGAVQPPVHRTPWLVIIAIVVVLVLVMAGVGTVIAVGFAHSSNQAASDIKQLSSPSPAGSPSPVPSSSPSPTTPTSASNAGLAVPLPDGWVVEAQDSETITLVNPGSTGSITIASGSSSPSQNAQQNKSTVDAFFKEQFPDTKNCTGSKTTTGSLNGVAGISWELCFTLTSGAQSVPAAALLFVGANPSGSAYYAMYMLTIASNMPAFSKECGPILKGIQWKLK